jgi:putative Mg2+ transporter-C (MgtC) family protein
MTDSMGVSGDYLEMCFRLVAALGAGALIGLERSYRGRPAGFRTHALVCTASSLLMLVTVYEALWFTGGAARTVLDPTRMSQGIMTGIGFLGAGVIVKEGLSVRGLTTAASIWMTAAIGILMGIGFYFPAGIATVLALGTLSVFRWIEGRMPSEYYANFLVRFPREKVMPESELRGLISSHGFDIANLSYRIAGQGREFEYQMVLRTLHSVNTQKLSARLAAEPSVTEFRIVPAGD